MKVADFFAPTLAEISVAGVIGCMNRANPASPRAPRRRLSHLRIAALGLLLLGSSSGLLCAADGARDFDLPAGQARDTLKRFAAQAQVEIVFPSENTLGVATNAVRGRLSPEEAIAALLTGTNLTATREPKTGSYSVRPRPSDPNAPRAAQESASPKSTANASSSSPTKQSAEESIIELSPFVTSEKSVTGYAATETLSGTRMRTDLKDVSASLSILTPEFLQDLGVTSFEKALEYTPSVNLDQGDAIGNGGIALRGSNGQSFSIRGFSGSVTGDQSISNDFFASAGPNDIYNTERVTLSLGPNALLIGVGNPQGAVVTSTKRAKLVKTATKVSFQGDRWDSHRASLDHNQPLIANRLALRLNGLYDRQREFRGNEGKNQERVTLSVVGKPWQNTKVTVNHENYSSALNNAALVWGFDGSALAWIAAGKPVVGNDPKNYLVNNSAQRPTLVRGLGLAKPLVNMRGQRTLPEAVFGGVSSNNYMSMRPWETFGLSQDTYLYGGARSSPPNKNRGSWTHLFVEQKLASNLYLELAGARTRYHRNLDQNNQNLLTIDPNPRLSDGSPNPGYLVPYNDSGVMLSLVDNSKSDEYRATLSYELDLARRNRWLGRHGFSLLGQTSTGYYTRDSMRVFNLATVGRTGWGNAATANVNRLVVRHYFLNGNVPELWAASELMDHAKEISAYGSLIGAAENDRAPVDLRLLPFTTPIHNKSTTDSLSLGWQARWLKDRLVTLFGYRTDHLTAYGAPTSQNLIIPETLGKSTSATYDYRFFDLASEVKPSRFGSDDRGISRTHGAVLHVFSWLSLGYTRSDNFTPGRPTVETPIGTAYANPSGETQDFSANFYLLANKLSVRVTHFDTTAKNQIYIVGTKYGGARNILQRLQDNYKANGDSHFQAMQSLYPIQNQTPPDVRDTKATGWELTVVYNPTRHWRVALSGSSNKNTLFVDDRYAGLYLANNTAYEGLATWRTFADELQRVASGTASRSFDLNPANSTDRQKAQDDATYIRLQADSMEKSYRDGQQLLGRSQIRSGGQYNFNGLTAYDFTEGRLKGWTAGGNFRWRSASVVGYRRMLDASGRPGLLSVDQPIKGKDTWDFGALIAWKHALNQKVNLRVQLNIQNLLNETTPVLTVVDTDTNAVYGTANAAVPVYYTLRRPRNFVLSTTFDF